MAVNTYSEDNQYYIRGIAFSKNGINEDGMVAEGQWIREDQVKRILVILEE